MKCARCGSKAAHKKGFCPARGRKMPPEKKKVQATEPVKVSPTIPQETVEPIVPKMEKELHRTRMAMEEIFGPEIIWAAPPEGALPEIEEDCDFPVTPCTDWPVGGEMDLDDSLPVYTTAPLRQDVQPAASLQENPEAVAGSALKLPEGRSLVKMVLLGLVTLGIYPTVIWSRIVTELNIAASRSENKLTMPYFGMLILAPLTLGVVPLVWMHRFCNRVGKQLKLRQCDFRFGAKDFWLWGVLGSLILVGHFIFIHKLMKSMNLINKHYNQFDNQPADVKPMNYGGQLPLEF